MTPRFLTPKEAHATGSVKWGLHGPDVMAAWVAEMDIATPPPIREALIDAVNRSATGYPFELLHDTATAIADWHRDRFGQAVDQGLVRFAPNVTGAIRQAYHVLAEPGERVIMSTPVYYPFFEVTETAGLQGVHVSMVRDGDRYRMDLDRLDAEAAEGGVLLLCDPHNPLGSVATRAELEAFADIARRHGNPVISDEIHAPLTYEPDDFIGFMTVAPDLADRTVTVSSATKAFNFPGLKMGWLVPGTAELTARVDAIPYLQRMGYSSFGGPATRAALTMCGDWLDDVMEELRSRRDLLERLLAELLPAAQWVPPDATYLAWIDVSAYGLGDDPAGRFLEHGVALSSGPQFGEEGTGFVRLNFGCAEETLIEIVERMANAVRVGS